MKRTRWLGLLAVAAAIVVGVLSFGGSALALGNGPKITSTGGGPVFAGGTFSITLSTDASATDAYSGFNMSLVYDSSKVTANSFNDLEVTSGLLGDDFCPPASLANNFGGTLTPPLLGAVAGCTALAGPPTPDSTVAAGQLGRINFTANTLGVTAVHMVSAGAPDNGGGSFGTYTINAADSSIQTNVLACGDGGQFISAAGFCGPLPVTGSQAWDNVILVQQQPPVLTLNKTFAPTSVVAGGQAFTITLKVTNAASPATTATGVSISDTLSALVAPIANVTLPAGCTNVGQAVTCTAASLAPGASQSFVLNVSKTDPSAGGSTYTNTATATDTNSPASTPASGSATLQVIPPAVAWSKSPTTGNLWETTGSQTYSFDEIMTNQGDPNGLGGFSFDVHYDPTIFNNPTIDLSPAVALFAASGRTLDCSITILGNGIDHVACASTGTIGVGPQWVGAQVMAHVTLTPLEIVTEQVRPNKENGIVTPVKDTNTTVTNTCGQPLNDGTIQPIPGQPECQGNPLQGVGPGGVLNDSMTTVTIRRLEGDVTKDCTVDVSDMQNEASRFGMSTGNLLYNVFYDVNLPLQHGDGEIDINDIQFVYGRMGSTCASPIPAQPAQALP